MAYGDARCDAVVGGALPGVHQAARTVVRHHPTGYRVAQETVHQEPVPLPPVVVHEVAYPLHDVAPLPDPDVGPVGRVVCGVKVATLAVALTPRLETAVVDTVPVLARVRRAPDAPGPT